jgi:hypothetical protein
MPTEIEGRPVQGRLPPDGQDDQHDGRPAEGLRVGSDARGPRSRNGRQAGRPGRSEGRRRRVEGPDRQRELDGAQPDEPGAQHRRRDDRRRRRATFPARSPSR